MSVRVRVLGAGEAMLWKELRLRALEESPDAFSTTYESQRDRPDSDWHRQIDATAASSLAEGLLAEADGEPAGILLCRVSEVDALLGHIQTMWVDPRFRRSGVGSALLAFALKWLRGRKANVVELGVNEENEAASALYRAFGFVLTGYREPLRKGSAQWIARMRCVLNSTAPEHNPSQTRRRRLSGSTLDLEIRAQVSRYLRGELSFVQLQKWVARSSWRRYVAGDREAAELIGAVELRLGEYAAGYWSEEDLQRALHALVDAPPS